MLDIKRLGELTEEMIPLYGQGVLNVGCFGKRSVHLRYSTFTEQFCDLCADRTDYDDGTWRVYVFIDDIEFFAIGGVDNG